MQTARVSSTCLLFLWVLVFVPQQAKGQLPDEILPGARIEMDSTAGAAIAPPASLPEAPAPQNARVGVRIRVIDKKFIAVMAALAAAESLRFTTHKLVLEHEYAAGAPWVTSVPRNP